MSAIASFVLMPTSMVDGLRNAAKPKQKRFGHPKDTYWDYLQQHGREVVEYEWSGYVFGTLLSYLQEQHQIDLMKSEYDDLSGYLTETRSATHFVFTEAHKLKYHSKLNPELFSEEALRIYYDQFNEANEPEAGRWMLDGVRAIQHALEHLDSANVIVFIVG